MKDCYTRILIGVSPAGAAVFISDAFEGSISDREIVIKSGFLDYMDPGDKVLAGKNGKTVIVNYVLKNSLF